MGRRRRRLLLLRLLLLLGLIVEALGLLLVSGRRLVARLLLSVPHYTTGGEGQSADATRCRPHLAAVGEERTGVGLGASGE